MRKSNRGLVQSFMPDLQRTFKSANKALTFLKQQGLSYRTKEFYNDWRSYAGYEKQKDAWKKTTSQHKISEKYFKPTTAKYKRKYVYTVGVSGYSDVFGEIKDQPFIVETDKNLTVGEVQDQIRRRIEKNPTMYMFSYRSSKILDIKARI